MRIPWKLHVNSSLNFRGKYGNIKTSAEFSSRNVDIALEVWFNTFFQTKPNFRKRIHKYCFLKLHFNKISIFESNYDKMYVAWNIFRKMNVIEVIEIWSKVSLFQLETINFFCISIFRKVSVKNCLFFKN